VCSGVANGNPRNSSGMGRSFWRGMTGIGQQARALIAGGRREASGWALAAVIAAAVPAWWLFAFTVDDALIPIRYARHLAAGEGYRWNLGGPVTDGVTPLPWALLLAPLAHAAPLVVLGRSKMLGLTLWLAAAGSWGAAVGRADVPRVAKAIAALAIALCIPLAAHAVSGMETALALALATWAALFGSRPLVAAALAGLAAALRPELAPWAIALGMGLSLAQSPKISSATAAALLAVAPFAVCAVVRLVAFGRLAPLAVLAKPSDLAHGAVYVAAASVTSLAPILVAAPLALRRAPPRARALVLAGLVHLVTVLAVGGDWMPYARLLVPILPSLLFAFVLTVPHAHPVASALRATAVLAVALYLLVVAAPNARHVGVDREELILRAKPELANATRIATVDIGWPTADTEATLIDLAGVTDPEVAGLPGGHTSKHVDPAFLLARDPDVLLLYGKRGDLALEQWQEWSYPRVVEARLARAELIARHFRPRAYLPLGMTAMGYVVLTRGPP
jgi:hypothetical protein